jgi:7-carboxy-7-deazaguanine synthase
MTLKVAEIFTSIQGESSYAGIPTVFLRLAGCNLRCRYCDTTYALDGGDDMTIDEVLREALRPGWNMVEITGGEPLIQDETTALAAALISSGRKVLVETNGSLDISVLPDDVIRVMDIKCPSSGENHMVMWENLWKLKPTDEVKFVISDRHDYEWARGIIKERFAMSETKVLLSTVYGELPPRLLVRWMLEDKLHARFQLAIHKYIWPPGSTGV